MRSLSVLGLFLVACTGQPRNTYIVEGVVVEVGEGEVVLDHEPVDGLMPAMVMGFPVADPALLAKLKPGYKVIARYVDEGPSSRLDMIRVTGEGPPPKLVTAPVRPGERWKGVDVPLHDGTTMRVGDGQAGRVLLTFIYTRCPLPEACPEIMRRFLALQDRVGDDVTLVAITLDPDHDSLEVLKTYARDAGVAGRFKLGRVEPAVLAELAKRAGMNVMPDGDQIAHSLRILVLDTEGRLVERYDTPRFDGDRVLAQLAGQMPPEP